MQLITSITSIREIIANQQCIAFVPTMGNLHEGHLSLMHQAKNNGGLVVASIFVNPLQFGPKEDFERYPRTLQADCEKMDGLVDVVFAPNVNEMYPQRQDFYIELPSIANELCGAARPGHFRGMATVVLKLLNIVQPQVAIFGKKDYQQLHIVSQMVNQFNLSVSIVGGETVRASDGLALSSRNQYLSVTEREEAPFLYRMLSSLKAQMLSEKADTRQLCAQGAESLNKRGWQVEYVSLRDRHSMNVMTELDGDGVILAAARLGNTRLLDNVEIFLD